MFFFGEDTEDMLRKQRISALVESVLLDPNERKLMPSSKIVQVVTNNSFSDGVYDYPCVVMGQKYKIGSYLRLKRWQLNIQNFQFIVYESQYLGGAGCQVIHGKKWDVQRLKCLMKTKIRSKHFLIMCQPRRNGAQETRVPQFNKTNVLKALLKEQDKKLNKVDRKQIKNKMPFKQSAMIDQRQVKGEKEAKDNNIPDEFIGFLKQTKINKEVTCTIPIEQN